MERDDRRKSRIHVEEKEWKKVKDKRQNAWEKRTMKQSKREEKVEEKQTNTGIRSLHNVPTM